MGIAAEFVRLFLRVVREHRESTEGNIAAGGKAASLDHLDRPAQQGIDPFGLGYATFAPRGLRNRGPAPFPVHDIEPLHGRDLRPRHGRRVAAGRSSCRLALRRQDRDRGQGEHQSQIRTNPH